MLGYWVVICLKNRTFAVSQTSTEGRLKVRVVLWFAWKIVLLQYHKHQKVIFQRLRQGCDLLEKSYFCSITNITLYCAKTALRLWFAWKIVLLQYHKHLPIIGDLDAMCCDLLEKSYFCSITNISAGKAVTSEEVVICLKNRTFAVSQTSYGINARND